AAASLPTRWGTVGALVGALSVKRVEKAAERFSPLVRPVQVQIMRRVRYVDQPRCRETFSHLAGGLGLDHSVPSSDDQGGAPNAFPLFPARDRYGFAQRLRHHVHVKTGPPTILAVLKSTRPSLSRKTVSEPPRE